jgi:hypothetical protein
MNVALKRPFVHSAWRGVVARVPGAGSKEGGLESPPS